MSNDFQWRKGLHNYEYRRGIKAGWMATVRTYLKGDADAWIASPGNWFGEPVFSGTFSSTDEAKAALDKAMPVHAWVSHK